MSDGKSSETTASQSPVSRPPVLCVTVERYYRFDVERIMRDFGADILEDMREFDQELDESLQTTFDELCGTWADRDHIDGKYVWLEDSTASMGYPDWPDICKRARELLPTGDSEASPPRSEADRG